MCSKPNFDNRTNVRTAILMISNIVTVTVAQCLEYLLIHTQNKRIKNIKNGPPEYCHIHTISLLHPPPHPTFHRLEKLGGLKCGRIKKFYKFLKYDCVDQ